MNWATITILVLLVMSLGINLGKHGESETRTYNFWSSLINFLIMFWLYYHAGIFN